METKKGYQLPELPYGYKDLAPFISEEQLTLHHQKHHQAYVNGANALLDKLEKARTDGSDPDMKALLKELSFNIGGHVLHTMFWGNLAPAGNGDNKPTGTLAKAIDGEFGTFDRFQKEFTQAAVSVEGSGWAALSYCRLTGRTLIMQIEKHNINVYPMFAILMVVDVWEHAYYLDYKNLRAKFIDAFWNLANWAEVEKRFKGL
ncbi:MAG: superoxide dismutase [Deltaproteobacteria bacterium]|nr:superoxide dismutase [Deltaproteobacteria bacterium]MBN2686551.1 superoxide dismutase [Deltaproteobacteria bacterium]